MDINILKVPRETKVPQNQGLALPPFRDFESICIQLDLKKTDHTPTLACAKHLDGWLKSQGLSLGDMNAERVSEYFEFLKTAPIKGKNGQIRQGYSVATKNSRKMALKKLLKAVVEDPRIDQLFKQHKPTVIAPSIDQHDYLSESEIQNLVSYCHSFKRSRTKKLMGWLIKILFETGCRIQEIKDLRTLDVHEHNDHFSLNITGKGNKTRVVYAHKNTIAGIRKDLQPATWMFETTQGNAIDVASSLKRLKIIAQAVLGEDRGSHVKHHTLRHSTAMHLLHGRKLDARTVSAYLGHANVSTTLNVYVHPKVSAEAVLTIFN